MSANLLGLAEWSNTVGELLLGAKRKKNLRGTLDEQTVLTIELNNSTHALLG